LARFKLRIKNTLNYFWNFCFQIPILNFFKSKEIKFLVKPCKMNEIIHGFEFFDSKAAIFSIFFCCCWIVVFVVTPCLHEKPKSVRFLLSVWFCQAVRLLFEIGIFLSLCLILCNSCPIMSQRFQMKFSINLWTKKTEENF